MSAVPKRRLTLEEYFAIEREAPFKSEFFDGEMFAMAGATSPHNIIKENMIGELYSRLKGGPCRTMSSDQRVKVDRTGLVTYPDIVIYCGKLEYAAEDQDTITNPVAIIEVLSPSTEKYVRGTKFRNYQLMPTFMEYILVDQNEPVCERFIRQADGSWGLVSFVGLESELVFTSVEARIPLKDIYAGVVFSEQPQNQVTPTK
ncbi:MAG: Uma2 family endonuclease [Gemmatales bacterium]